MRRNLLAVLVLAVFFLGTVTLASAEVVTWKVLESPLAAGRGPGPDGLIGVPGCVGLADNDDLVGGETNGCNLSNAANCGGGTPTNGSFSYGVTEYVMNNSCAGGTNAGKSCTLPVDCPGGICSPCADNPTGWDAYMYMGKIGSAAGTLTVCQEGGVAKTTAMSMGMSDPGVGFGAMCSVLKGGPYTSSACGVGVTTTTTVSMTNKMTLCTLPVGDLDNVTSTGRSYDVDDTNPTAFCGYSTDDLKCLLAQAKAQGAEYMSVACSYQENLPPSPTPCVGGATSKSVIVSWTTGAPNDCISACPTGGCLMGAAENVE